LLSVCCRKWENGVERSATTAEERTTAGRLTCGLVGCPGQPGPRTALGGLVEGVRGASNDSNAVSLISRTLVAATSVTVLA
jgi:hypothetical protein